MNTAHTVAFGQLSPSGLGALNLVSAHELENLRAALVAGMTPLDLERKLATLDVHDPVKHDVRQKTLLFLALLNAVREGVFRDVPVDCQQRILRVVAYVRKTDDAITDLREGGYLDDLAEVRAAVHDLAGLLQRFKCWRLEHQVPALWQHAA